MNLAVEQYAILRPLWPCIKKESAPQGVQRMLILMCSPECPGLRGHRFCGLDHHLLVRSFQGGICLDLRSGPKRCHVAAPTELFDAHHVEALQREAGNQIWAVVQRSKGVSEHKQVKKIDSAPWVLRCWAHNSIGNNPVHQW